MFAQKNNSARIIDTYKNQVLLRSRQELTLDECEDECNSNVGTNTGASKDCLEKQMTVQLTDVLKSSKPGTQG